MLPFFCTFINIPLSSDIITTRTFFIHKQDAKVDECKYRFPTIEHILQGYDMTEAGEICSENWGSKALQSVGKVAPGITLKVNVNVKYFWLALLKVLCQFFHNSLLCKYFLIIRNCLIRNLSYSKTCWYILLIAFETFSINVYFQ